MIPIALSIPQHIPAQLCAIYWHIKLSDRRTVIRVATQTVSKDLIQTDLSQNLYHFCRAIID